MASAVARNIVGEGTNAATVGSFSFDANGFPRVTLEISALIMFFANIFQSGAGDAQQPQDGVLKRSNHPTALLFHVGFKAGALLMSANSFLLLKKAHEFCLYSFQVPVWICNIKFFRILLCYRGMYSVLYHCLVQLMRNISHMW